MAGIQNFLPLFLGQLSFSVLIGLMISPFHTPQPLKETSPPGSSGSLHLPVSWLLGIPTPFPTLPPQNAVYCLYDLVVALTPQLAHIAPPPGWFSFSGLQGQAPSGSTALPGKTSVCGSPGTLRARD